MPCEAAADASTCQRAWSIRARRAPPSNSVYRPVTAVCRSVSSNGGVCPTWKAWIGLTSVGFWYCVADPRSWMSGSLAACASPSSARASASAAAAVARVG
jgi:hypothetical protein